MAKFVIAFLSMFILMTTPALAVNVLNVCTGANAKVADSSLCQDRQTQADAKTNPVKHVVLVASSIVATIAGVAAIILIIVSGFKLIVGGGTPESVKSARGTLVAAIIGLAIISLSWTILNFAVDTLIKN